MLSYQHGYHAGGPADLHKHIVLAELLARMTVKPRGIGYLETHAGRGLYDLGSAEARKTGEAAQGIARIRPDPATPFWQALAAVRAEAGARAYPGSPLLAQKLLRPQDRLTLFELHPAEHAALARTLGPAPGTAVHRRDGFAGVLDLAATQPRRGLVLVDPSYEVKAEYEEAAGFVLRLLAKWPGATVLVWYPLLPAARHLALLAWLAPLRPAVDEVRFLPPPARGMTGSGLALVGAPHGAAASAFAAARRQGAPVLAPG